MGLAIDNVTICWIQLLTSVFICTIVAVWYVWPSLIKRSRNSALSPLLWVHVPRYVGMTLLVPPRRWKGRRTANDEALALSAHLRTLWKGLYVVNGGYDGPKGQEALRTGHADAVAYGRAFLANPDLPRRLQLGAVLNEPDPTTFYGGGAAGYTSFPALP